MRNWTRLGQSEIREWDWQPSPTIMLQTCIDPELAYITGTADDEVVNIIVLVAVIDDHWSSEMNVMYRNTDHDNIATADGETAKEACMNVCFDAAVYGFFDRLNEHEMDYDNAVSKLANECLSLWANKPSSVLSHWLDDDDIDDLGWFVDKAMTYVTEHGPSADIEMGDNAWSTSFVTRQS